MKPPESFHRCLAGPVFATIFIGCGTADEPGKPTDVSGVACAGERAEGAICLAAVTGRVVDEADAPMSDLDVTVCGPVCFLGTTNQDGTFSIRIESFVIASQYSVQPHGSPRASTFYYQLPEDPTDGSINVGTLRVVGLPNEGDLLTTKLDLAGGAAPAQSATSGDVTLLLGEGTELRLAVRDALGGEEGKVFRARELEPELAAEFAPELVDARVFALGPFEADMSGQDDRPAEVGLRVANRGGWRPGSEVEILALGTYLDPDWLSPSEFEYIGTGVVSANGETIELSPTSAGPGLRHLTWVAMRL